MEQPTRIAFGITDLDIGGAERTLVELVTRLDRRHWSPSVVCLQPPGPLADVLKSQGIPVDSLDMTSARHAIGGGLRWLRILRRERPALLQTFLFHANLLGRMVGTMAGVPIIVSGVRVAERRSRVPLWADRFTHRLVTRHVCVSEGVRKFTAERARIPDSRLLVIPNGVDIDRFHDARRVDLGPFGVAAEHRTLLYLGRLDPQKGLDDLLEALSLLAKRRPLAERLRVVLVGAGPLRETLEADVAMRSLGEVVHFVGWQPNPQDWLAAADGLVLPSRWEGMPNAVLEAMAAGLPVIATAVEGTSDLVRPGKTGWLIPPGDRTALAGAIGEFLDHPEQGRQFGKRGRELVAWEYSYETMVRRYEDLYRELLRTERG